MLARNYLPIVDFFLCTASVWAVLATAIICLVFFYDGSSSRSPISEPVCHDAGCHRHCGEKDVLYVVDPFDMIVSYESVYNCENRDNREKVSSRHVRNIAHGG